MGTVGFYYGRKPVHCWIKGLAQTSDLHHSLSLTLSCGRQTLISDYIRDNIGPHEHSACLNKNARNYSIPSGTVKLRSQRVFSLLRLAPFFLNPHILSRSHTLNRSSPFRLPASSFSHRTINLHTRDVQPHDFTPALSLFITILRLVHCSITRSSYLRIQWLEASASKTLSI